MQNIQEYLKDAKPEEKAEFERLKKIVYKLAPEVEESISYGMPTFKYKGKPLVYFGIFKNHMSLFATSAPTEELRDRLKDYRTSKGTIQFTADNALSDELIEDLLRARLSMIS